MGSKPKIRGIVLAGAYQRGDSPFDDLLPRPLVPVAQTPLVTYAVRWLREGGISQATICANSAARAVRTYLSNGFPLSMGLDYLEDWMPRGAAGCARDAGLRSDADTFVIADGTAIPVGELRGVLETHQVCQAALTVVAHHDPNYRATGERPLSPSGIYVFNRRVFDFIPATGFFDIKESLIPCLHRAGERVMTHTGYGACPRVVDAESYLALNEWMVEWIARQPGSVEGRCVLGEAVVHPSASVDPSARLLGPVLLGPCVTVQAGATIIGPTAIGAGSRVERNAVVSRTVAWSDCVVGRDAMVDRCLLANEAVVPPHESLFSALKARGPRSGRSLAERFGRDRSRRETPAGTSLPCPVQQRAGSA